MINSSQPKITLTNVNDKLLDKIYNLIAESDDPNTLVALSGAVAKLNLAAKGNEFFVQAKTEAELVDDEQLEVLEGTLITDER